MNIEEAQKITELSKEETDSLKKYLGFWHSKINILGDLSPKVYEKMAHYDRFAVEGDKEDFKEAIQDFVNIYSIIYKDGKKEPPRNLYRGTSKTRVKSIHGYTNEFYSTSTDESIAKTFSKYGDDAILHVHIGEGVPFFDPSKYVSEYVRDEHEIIIAPFCKATVEAGSSTYDGYTHYQMHVEKEELEEKSQEQIDALTEELVNGYEQNIESLKDVGHLEFKLESLDRAYSRALIEGDKEDIQYIVSQREQTREELENIKAKTYEFKHKLQGLLKGMCRQKEKEIDEARSVISEEEKRRNEDRKKRELEEKARQEALQKEEQRTSKLQEFYSKITQNTQNASKINTNIWNTYNSLMRNENVAEGFARKLGITYKGVINDSNIEDLISDVENNLQGVLGKTEGVDLNQNASLEDIGNASKELAPLFANVSYGLELTSSFDDIEKIHKQQIENEIKRSLYDKVQTVIQNAKVQKYLQEKMTVQNEQIGFFGRLFGKEILRSERLKNLDLKIQLAKNVTPQTQGKYSVREMLAEMHICADSELGGVFSQEMQKLYDAIKENFQDEKSGKFSEEYIKRIAMEKQAQMNNAGLPVVADKKQKVHRGIKSQTKALQAENGDMQRKLLTNRVSRSTWVQNVGNEPQAINLFEQKLKAISSATRENQKEYTKEELEDTLQL